MNSQQRLLYLSKWIGSLYLIGLLLWLVFSQWVVPPVIELAYHERSFSTLNNLIKDRESEPLGYYQYRWASIRYQGLMAWLGIGLMGSFFFIALKMVHQPVVLQRMAGEATAGSLGAIRMLTCTILLTNVIWEDLASTAFLPTELRHAMGVFQIFYFFPFFESFLSSEGSLKVFELATGIILFLGVVGWKTRWVIPLGAICYLIFGGILRHYFYFYHTFLTSLTLMIVLSFLPCGDGFSLDRLLKIYKGQLTIPSDRPFPVYTWSRYVCWGTIALSYFGAGLSKLYYGGPMWWEGKNIRLIFYHDTLQPTGFDWGLSWVIDLAPEFVFGGLGLLVLLGELFYPLVLFFRAARFVFPGLMWVMHLGVFFFQNILFFDLILLQFVFFDFSVLRRELGERLANVWGKVNILYDGECAVCRKTIRVLGFLDVLEQLDAKDFRRVDLNQFNQKHNLNLTAIDLDKETYVLQEETIHRGFYGYQIISKRIPVFWLLLPLFYLPGLTQLGVVIYRSVARRRFNLPIRDSECMATDQELSEIVDNRLTAEKGISRYPLLLGILFFMLVFSWFFKIEYYPLTPFPMYSEVPHIDVSRLTYIKAFSKHQDGTKKRTTFVDAIGATATNRYLPIIKKCFLPEIVDICEKFLRASGSQYNQRASESQKIHSYVVQKWYWNMTSDPHDPNHGRMIEEFTFNVLKPN